MRSETGKASLAAPCGLRTRWSGYDYAIFMLLVLLTLFAAWRRHVPELPLFAVTVLWVLIHLVGDMTSPLTLSF